MYDGKDQNDFNSGQKWKIILQCRICNQLSVETLNALAGPLLRD